jgi:branched-chain amino acid transport system substrate-binding protein
MKRYAKYLALFLIVPLLLGSVLACSPSEPSAAKTLKVGMINFLGWPLGFDNDRGTKLQAEMINAKGGVKIGNDMYKIEIVSYDSNVDQATEVAAINKLVYEDKVKFILGLPMFIPADLPITEANKVVFLASCADIVTQMDPKWQYTACPTSMNPPLTISIGWILNKYPQFKSYLFYFADDQNGHNNYTIYDSTFKAYGKRDLVQFEYYPATATDLSAVGTKVAQLKPDVYVPSGAPSAEGNLVTAIWNAGYRGQYFINHPTTYESLKATCPEASLPGMITIANATEFDPPQNASAKEFKEAFIKKNGKWDIADSDVLAYLPCLLAAAQQVGSIDPEAINKVVQSGLKFTAPNNESMMISRPDFGNSRTVDSICAVNFVQYEQGGKMKLLETINADNALKLFRQAYPGK